MLDENSTCLSKPVLLAKLERSYGYFLYQHLCSGNQMAIQVSLNNAKISQIAIIFKTGFLIQQLIDQRERECARFQAAQVSRSAVSCQQARNLPASLFNLFVLICFDSIQILEEIASLSLQVSWPHQFLTDFKKIQDFVFFPLSLSNFG